MKLSWFNLGGSLVANNNNSSDKDAGTSSENNNAVSHMHAACFMGFSILFLAINVRLKFWPIAFEVSV